MTMVDVIVVAINVELRDDDDDDCGADVIWYSVSSTWSTSVPLGLLNE